MTDLCICIQYNCVYRSTYSAVCSSPFHLRRSWLRTGRSLLWLNSPCQGLPHSADSQWGCCSVDQWDETSRCGGWRLAGPGGFSLQMEPRPSERSQLFVLQPQQTPGEREEHEQYRWLPVLRLLLKMITALLLPCPGYSAWPVHIWRGLYWAGLYCWWQWLFYSLGCCNPLHLRNLCTSLASSSSSW